MLFVLMNPIYANACAVWYELKPKNALKRNSIVFSGTVVSCQTKNEKSILEFQVAKVWKGELQKSYRIFQPNCDNAPIGDLFLVFSKGIDENGLLKLDHGMCPVSYIRPIQGEAGDKLVQELGHPIHTF